MNYSKQRESVLQTLRENVVHPTAEYIYDIMSKSDSSVSLATLYRNLNQLTESGRIKKIDGLENSAHYDHNTDEHYHFICKECKKIFDISADVAADIVKNTEEKTGFVIQSHDVIFHGLCNDCKKICK